LCINLLRRACFANAIALLNGIPNPLLTESIQCSAVHWYEDTLVLVSGVQFPQLEVCVQGLEYDWFENRGGEEYHLIIFNIYLIRDQILDLSNVKITYILLFAVLADKPVLVPGEHCPQLKVRGLGLEGDGFEMADLLKSNSKYLI
jgi:hypothetical protein